MLPIFTILIFFYLAANGYIYARALQTIQGMPTAARVIFSLLFWLSAAGMFIALAIRRSEAPAALQRVLFDVGGVWLAFTLYMTLILLAADAARWLFAPQLRHGFLYALGATMLLLAYGYINYRNPRINRIAIATEKPFDGDSMKIVAVSDLHLGHGTGKKQLRRYVDMINAEKPDLILIGGDLVDNNVRPLLDNAMHDELNMLHAPLGIYMAPGNHEYISGYEECNAFIARTGIRMLRDSTVTLPNGIRIILSDDYTNPEMTSRAIAAHTADAPTVMVKHQPLEIAETTASGIDLLFCGHTHHGQMWPGNILVDHLFEQAHGHRKWGDTHVYVSSGLSLWGPPFRIGTSSDMAVFTIHHKHHRYCPPQPKHLRAYLWPF